MVAKRFHATLTVVLMALLATPACGPSPAGEGPATESPAVTGSQTEAATPTVEEAPATVAVATEAPATDAVAAEAVASDTITSSEPVASSSAVTPSDSVASANGVASSDAVTSSTGVTSPVETSPGTTEATPGQAEPGAGTGSAGETPEAESEVTPGDAVAFTDSTYKFTVNYPNNFVVATLPAEELAMFTPTPAAVFRFLSPTAAASDLGNQEVADLEVRIFAAGAETSPESWLIANGILASDGSVPATASDLANGTAVQVCAPSMMAPGCSNFVMGNGYIYQFTPATIEGEEMATSFMLTQ